MNIINQVQKLVSVAMTTYNGELFLEEQIESILAQSYKNLELIIVDDCSTDNTIKILYQYKQFKNIKIFQNEERLGVIKNFEKAISLCNADLIALCDQDDIWYEDKIAKLVEAIENAVLVCSDVVMIDRDRNIIHKSWFKYQSIYIPTKPNVFDEVVYKNYALGCTMLFKRELVTHIIPIPEDSLSHDWWIAANASLLGKFNVLKDPLMLKRKHNKNVSETGADNLIVRFKKYFSKQDRQKRDERYRTALKRIKCYLQYLRNLNAYQNDYLQNLINYYEVLVKKRIHFNAVWTAYKYRFIFYPNFNPVTRMIQIIAKLF